MWAPPQEMVVMEKRLFTFKRMKLDLYEPNLQIKLQIVAVLEN